MSDLMLFEPAELTDAEIDAVGGGLAIGAGNLVNVQLNNVLNNNFNNNTISVDVNALNHSPIFVDVL